MALTKITGQVINTATDVTVGVLTVTNTLAVGGTVSIGGTLTYEDVTNVDAVGLITARDGIVVGSGITLSKDGDIFVTGVSTFQSTKVTSLDVSAGLGIAESLFHIGDTNTRLAFPSNDTISLETAGTEAARINSDGKILIGSTAIRNIGGSSASSHLQIEGLTANTSSMALINNQANTNSPVFSFGKTRGTSDGAVTTVADGDTLGEIEFCGADGTDIENATAQIKAIVNGTVSGNTVPTDLIVETSPSNNANRLERVRITGSGKVGINTDNPRGRFHILQGGSGFDYGTTGNLIVENNSGSTIQILAPETHSSNVHFGDNSNGMVGRIEYDHTHNAMRFFTSNNERVTIKSSGYVGVGTTSASDFIHINATAQSQKGILLESKDTAYGQITFDTNKTSADHFLGKLVSKWNGTVVAELRFESGDDTTNKDDGMMTFSTSHDGTLAERMRITESGQLCLGTNGNAASANNMLEIESTGTSIIKLNNTDDGVAQLSLCNTGSSNGHIKQEAGIMRFLIANTEYMYLNGSDLGIGESSPDHRLHVNSGSTNGVATFESTDAYAHIYVRDNGTHATGTYFGVQSDAFRWVTHDGSSSNERLRLTASGNLISNGSATARIAFGTNAGVLYSGFSRYDGAAQDVGISHYATTNAGTSFVEHFRMEHNGTLKGTDTSIGSLSDRRLKKDIVNYSYDISKFKQFKPKSFNWINPEVHGDKSNVKGFIAQEIELVDGDWVEDSWIKESDPDFHLISNTTTTNGVGETVGVSKISKFGYKDAMYISVVQQLISRIETLEAEVSALKGG